MRQAAVLVGGRGTRLGSLTDDTPKPLLEVGGRPFLDYVLFELWRSGIEDVVLLAGYRAADFEPVAARWHGRGLDVRLAVEAEPSGTAGALAGAADLLAERFLMLNGDTLFDLNPLDLARRLDDGLAGAIALRPVADAGRFGTVDLEGGLIRAFREKAPGIGAGLINGGAYALSRRILDAIGSPPCSLERDVFPALAAAGRLAGAAFDRPFIDIGIPEDFARAQDLVPAVTTRPAAFIDSALLADPAMPGGPVPNLPGAAAAAVKRLNDLGWLVFVGLDADTVGDRVLRRVNDGLRPLGAHIDALYRRDEGPVLDGWPIDRDTSVTVGGADADPSRRWPSFVDRIAESGLPRVPCAR